MKVNNNYISLIGLIAIVLAGTAISGCVEMFHKSPQMSDPINYVREHKGEGPRRVVEGSEDEAVKFGTTVFPGYEINRAPHAIYASTRNAASNKVHLTYAIYFYPTQNASQTEVEVLIASPLFDSEYIRTSQNTMLDSISNYFTATRAQEKKQIEAERVSEAEREAKKQDSEKRYQEALKMYRSAAVKPQLPEEARKFKVQAEGAVRDKDFAGAVDLYGQALKIAPWWPEGHFNRALVLAETKEFDTAIIEMKRYLALVPNAPNARAAQDKIYDWERKAQK